MHNHAFIFEVVSQHIAISYKALAAILQSAVQNIILLFDYIYPLKSLFLTSGGTMLPPVAHAT